MLSANNLMMATGIVRMMDNASGLAKDIGNGLLIFLGIVLLIWGGVTFVKGLLGHGNGKPVNWGLVLLMILFGAFFMLRGFGGLEMFADIGTSTLEDLSK